ncbi:MAG: hypothetical protein GXP15_03395 [Gammaproteobacteria bacterium]|nr:hypothetical protein [Gammaproteobacteria bacterium]
MEILLFTAVGIAIYVAADWLLKRIESAREEPLKYRQIIFFIIFLTLAMTSFPLLQRFLSS